jgi:tetratricopeptide (TPR) repeat protein
MMGLDAVYIDQFLEAKGTSVDVFNRGLSSDLPSRRLTVLAQNISEKPDAVLIGIDYANYLEKPNITSNLATQTKFGSCETTLPKIQEFYSFHVSGNFFGFDPTNLKNPKLSTLKLISESFMHETDAEIATKNKKIDTLFEKSITSYNEGNLEDAILYNEKILEIDPNYYDAILNNGYLLTSQGKLDEATYFINKAVSLAPDSLRANYNKQFLLEKQGKIAEAEVLGKKIDELQKQKAVLNNTPQDFEASKTSSGKQSWRFDEPAWRVVQSDQWISTNIQKRGNLETYSMPFDPNGNEAKSLVKIIQNLQQNNINVVLFSTPIYKELYHSVDSCQFKNFEIFLEKLSIDFDITVVFLHDKYLELDIWRDQTHVIWGKTIYTEDVAKIILGEM